MLVAGGFCYRMLLDKSYIARESQNSPAPARASDRLLSISVGGTGGWRAPEAGGTQLFGFCGWLYNSGSHITHGEPS